jgi:hypothetical protein
MNRITLTHPPLTISSKLTIHIPHTKQAFTTRLIKIMRYCQSSVGAQDRNEFLQTLDESEKVLFRIGQESAWAARRWMSRSSSEGKIRTAGVLQRSFSTKGCLM